MIKAELLRDADDELIKRLAFDQGWVFQEKHNGDRRLIEKQGGIVRDYNRNGDPGKGLPPNVIAAIRRHPAPRFIIDVELVSTQIFVFDALWLIDENLVLEPYSYRKASVHSQFDGFDPCIVPVESARTPEQKIALIQHLREIHAEGFVAKELVAPYRPAINNQRFNYRYKFWKTLDAVVIGDSTKRVDGQLRDSVRLGCYAKNGFLKDICGATKKSTFTLRPGDVVEVKYLYGTGTLDIVQPAILHPRFDKRPDECTIDQIEVNKNWRNRC